MAWGTDAPENETAKLPVSRRPPTAVTAAALALVSLLAAGCTGGTESSSDPSASAAGKPTGTRGLHGESEGDQGERAKAALETVSPDDPEFVESGLERVREGVHHRSPLMKGKAYKLSVACVGTGSVQVVIANRDPQSVPCDGVPASRRVESAPEQLPVDITAEAGATGMVAWQVVSVSPRS
ncbi:MULTISPECIES: hypothetical protein [unclassified Streptomyces]|uniref:hypothetical protein n=1 Tax=unclassified Streptomyces TaxID=2593676 RepID=UPI001F375E4B|nr:hypothetical protein [Streptomyces sp. SID5770]